MMVGREAAHCYFCRFARSRDRRAGGSQFGVCEARPFSNQNAADDWTGDAQ